MFGDMMEKLQEMKQQMEDAKSRLSDLTVTTESASGKIKITTTGNRKIKELWIDESLAKADKEELEELLLVALNQALDAASDLHEKEMQGVAKFNFPGLDL